MNDLAPFESTAQRDRAIERLAVDNYDMAGPPKGYEHLAELHHGDVTGTEGVVRSWRTYYDDDVTNQELWDEYVEAYEEAPL